jgi:hypothetical protein
MPTPALWNRNNDVSLAERHEQLRRTSQAMWQLIKNKFDLRDDELHYALARVEQTKLRPEQGLLDCSLCRRPVHTAAKCCLYCGTAPHAPARAIRLVRT